MPNGKKKILIIEDDRLLSGLLRKKLEMNEYEAEEAMDSKEAFSALEKKNFDMILLDLLLPGIDGYSILKQIKQDNKLRHIPVIVISNLGGADEEKRVKKLGALDYMIKAENSPDAIIQRVKEAIL